MKVAELDALKKQLRNAPLDPAYLLTSKEAYELEQAANSVIEAAPDHQLIRLRGEQVTADRVLSELESQSLFGGGSLVWIREGDKLKKAVVDQLEKYLERPNPANILLVSAGSWNSATRFYKAVDKVGCVLSIPPPKPWEREGLLAQWLVQQASSQGKQIDQRTALHIVQKVGGDQQQLVLQLDKLCCYVGDRPQIDSRDVEAIVTQLAAPTGWELSDALLGQNGALAASIAEKLLSGGTALIALIAMLRKQLQTTLQVWEVAMMGGGANEVTQVVPFLRGKAAERKLTLARQFGGERLKRALVLLADSELQLKSSTANEPVQVLSLIARILQT